MDNNIDIKILEALRDGDRKSFEAVFIACYNKIKAFINGYIKSEADAEELAQDLFVNLWINRQTIDPAKSFNSYLHTIARNGAVNFLRHKYVEAAYIGNLQYDENNPSSEEELIAKELGLLIDAIVEKMPPQRKQIYILSKNKGLTNSEIAEKLHTTKGTVESQLSLALKEIRKAVSFFFIALF